MPATDFPKNDRYGSLPSLKERIEKHEAEKNKYYGPEWEYKTINILLEYEATELNALGKSGWQVVRWMDYLDANNKKAIHYVLMRQNN